jgi:thiol-disulfide isomerase/thioredoxin
MKLLAGLFLLSAVALAGPATSHSAATIAGDYEGTALVHGQNVPLHLRITGSEPNLHAALVNGPEESPATTVTFKDNHLLIDFSYYAKNFDLTLSTASNKHTLTGTFGAIKPRYPITLNPSHSGPAAGTLNPAIQGDWEIATTSSKGEAAWSMHITQPSPTLLKAVIQRIDGDTGSLYAVPGSDLYSHFNANGAALYRIDPAPNGTLIVSNLLRADLNPPEQQNLIARRPNDARSQNLAPPTDTAAQTTMKDPSVPLAFNFPDLSGKLVSNRDPRFDGKVVIVAIGGSWCPNCHDEAPMLESLYKKFHAQGLEIVNISFEEEEPGQEKDPPRLRAFIARYGITYTVLLGGTTDQLNEKLPQANNLNSWPTSFFIGRDGLVKEIHAGFAGPANPEAHDALIKETTNLVEHLLAEPAPVRTASAAN